MSSNHSSHLFIEVQQNKWSNIHILQSIKFIYLLKNSLHAMHITSSKFICQHIFMQYVHCKVRASVLGSGHIFTTWFQTSVVTIKKICDKNL